MKWLDTTVTLPPSGLALYCILLLANLGFVLEKRAAGFVFFFFFYVNIMFGFLLFFSLRSPFWPFWKTAHLFSFPSYLARVVPGQKKYSAAAKMETSSTSSEWTTVRGVDPANLRPNYRGTRSQPAQGRLLVVAHTAVNASLHLTVACIQPQYSQYDFSPLDVTTFYSTLWWSFCGLVSKFTTLTTEFTMCRFAAVLVNWWINDNI